MWIPGGKGTRDTSAKVCKRRQYSRALFGQSLFWEEVDEYVSKERSTGERCVFDTIVGRQ